MRNWNKRLSQPTTVISAASRLPMRNWNHPDGSDVLARHSFQTTYEELKQEMGCRHHITRGFQTTYEELKLIHTKSIQMSNKLPDYLWGIETQQRSKKLRRVQASRLPMRNWNLPPSVKSPKLSFQTTYEELKQVKRQAIDDLNKLLPDYLWGIETWIQRKFRGILPASRLPMRNWNLVSLQLL